MLIFNLMLHLCIQKTQFNDEGRRLEGFRKCRMTLMYYVVCELKIDVIFGILLSHLCPFLSFFCTCCIRRL